MCRLTVRAHKIGSPQRLPSWTMENVTVLARTSLFGYGDHNYLTLAERVTDHLADKPAHLPRMRMWKSTGQASHSGDRGD